jgi:hypothetical protein
MASVLKVDKLDPQGGTALEIGTSGDTITVPTGAGLTVVDEVKTNKISPASGVAFALGDSGDTFTIPSGATITNSGTATGFGGITGILQWRMSSDLTGGVDPISANLETVDTDGFAILGTDMAVSSGLWTFPATGLWWVRAHGNVYFNGDSRHQHLAIHTTLNDSSYSLAASGYSFLQQTESNTAQNHIDVDFIFDVTDTTNCKVKFAFENVTDSSVVLAGGSSASYTWFTFIRLGDT